MSIATRTGDSGETSLWSGERVGKDDVRVEAYGSLDELSSFLGLARHSCRLESSIKAIESVQRCLVRAEAELASSQAAGKARSRIGPEDEEALTEALHTIEARIKLKGFVLPGMTEGSAALDLARSVCRRAERRIVALSRESPVSPEILKYVNRLSDYLFMLARDEEESEGRITYA